MAVKHPAPTVRGLVGPVLVLDTGESFQWSDPNRRVQKLVVGQSVKVLTDEGALRRGRRRWHPGAIGVIASNQRPARNHDRGWMVTVNGFTVLLFDDELDENTEAKEATAA